MHSLVTVRMTDECVFRYHPWHRMQFCIITWCRVVSDYVPSVRLQVMISSLFLSKKVLFSEPFPEHMHHVRWLTRFSVALKYLTIRRSSIPVSSSWYQHYHRMHDLMAWRKIHHRYMWSLRCSRRIFSYLLWTTMRSLCILCTRHMLYPPCNRNTTWHTSRGLYHSHFAARLMKVWLPSRCPLPFLMSMEMNPPSWQFRIQDTGVQDFSIRSRMHQKKCIAENSFGWKRY